MHSLRLFQLAERGKCRICTTLHSVGVTKYQALGHRRFATCDKLVCEARAVTCRNARRTWYRASHGQDKEEEVTTRINTPNVWVQCLDAEDELVKRIHIYCIRQSRRCSPNERTVQHQPTKRTRGHLLEQPLRVLRKRAIHLIPNVEAIPCRRIESPTIKSRAGIHRIDGM